MTAPPDCPRCPCSTSPENWSATCPNFCAPSVVRGGWSASAMACTLGDPQHQPGHPAHPRRIVTTAGGRTRRSWPVEEGVQLVQPEPQGRAVAVVLGVTQLDHPVVATQLDAATAVAAALGRKTHAVDGQRRKSFSGTDCRWMRSQIRWYSAYSSGFWRYCAPVCDST